MRGATPRAVTTAAPVRHRAGGAGRIPDSQLPQDDDTTARFAAECQSFRDHLRCRVCARRIRKSPAGADNRLVAGSSPPSPTTQSCANPEFPVSAEHPRFSAVWGGCHGPFAVSVGSEDRPEADWGGSVAAWNEGHLGIGPEVTFRGAGAISSLSGGVDRFRGSIEATVIEV
jgi:hypothetical protein